MECLFYIRSFTSPFNPIIFCLLLKIAWLVSITLLFTVSVLVFSSQAAYAGQNQQVPEFAVRCYDTATNTIINPPSVAFEDMIQTGNVDPAETQRLCVSGLKHSKVAPDDTIYWIQYEDDNDQVGLLFPKGVQFVDQFSGKFTSDLSHFDILTPAVVDNDGAENMQFFSGWGFDKIISADMNPDNTMVEYTDSIGGTHTLTLELASSYESAAVIAGMGALGGMEMNCYTIKAETPPTVIVGSKTVVTKFGTILDLDVGEGNILCVMGEKIVPPPPTTPKVGGEIIPIETTSLLLAGAQTFSWMIPVILSGIGIGLFAVSRKTE
jgi:hypothetical protein